MLEASGISADGLTIVGYGINPEGVGESWIARLDEQPQPEKVPEPSFIVGLLAFGILKVGSSLRVKH